MKQKAISVKKVRADLLVIEQFPEKTLDEAKKLILAGLVRASEDYLIKNPSELINSDTNLTIDENRQYVSRGALKLKDALDKYLPDLTGKVAVDIGASTGGFTDLMLQYGASKVYAIDVGYGQLHYKLRQDKRVILMERFNAREMTESSLPEKIDVVTMDLSFISVLKVLKGVNSVLKKNGWAFILVKPQFEAERHEVGQGGVVRDPQVREKYVMKVKGFVEHELSWIVIDTIPSPILGPKGNQEFVLICKKDETL